MKLKSLKTYIKNNLTNIFIQLSRFLINMPIQFVHMSDGSLNLYIKNKDLNNLAKRISTYCYWLINLIINWDIVTSLFSLIYQVYITK